LPTFSISRFFSRSRIVLKKGRPAGSQDPIARIDAILNLGQHTAHLGASFIRDNAPATGVVPCSAVSLIE
jgi:hypothetical protein